MASLRRYVSGAKGPGKEPLRLAGLFAGIGGIEVGLHRAGHHTVFLCEKDEAARSVLQSRFADIDFEEDVANVRGADLPDLDLLAGGFPCQDLSQAGRTAGIGGKKSGLVSHMFRIVDELVEDGRAPRWLLFENVQNMLRLDQGKAMAFLVSELSRRGFSWAYRVVDTQAFGLPQRRQRVIMLASQTHDPASVLLTDDAGDQLDLDDPDNERGHGFYWTEGIRGLGWAPGGIPTLKCGSALGIPSPPAIWMPDDTFVTPSIRDAERLQGFDADWTLTTALPVKKRSGPRWRMVGNAVSVPVAEWVGHRLRHPKPSDIWRRPWKTDKRWPDAAAGGPSSSAVWEYDCSKWPLLVPRRSIAKFIQEPELLSTKAASGFRERTFRSNLDLEREPVATFLNRLDEYIQKRDGDIDELRARARHKAATLAAGGSLRGGGGAVVSP